MSEEDKPGDAAGKVPLLLVPGNPAVAGEAGPSAVALQLEQRKPDQEAGMRKRDSGVMRGLILAMPIEMILWVVVIYLFKQFV